MRTATPTMLLLAALGLCAGRTNAQSNLGTSFTYQGQINQGATPLNGNVDVQFTLFDVAAGGASLASVPALFVPISAGQFATTVDFGSKYDGRALWVEVAVRYPPGSGAYTTLLPRQAMTGAPYAQGLRLPLSESVAVAGDNALRIANSAFEGRGLLGLASGTGGKGVYGSATGSGGIGLYGDCGATGIGLVGFNSISGNTGEIGGQYVAVRATASTTDSGAFVGTHPSGNGAHLANGTYGVRGIAGNQGSVAVSGENPLSLGLLGTNLYGVYGSTAQMSSGVRGRCSSNFYLGVEGSAVAGVNDNGNEGALGAGGAGVYGHSETGLAGYFSGGVRVYVGNLYVQQNDGVVATLQRGVTDGVVVSIGGVQGAVGSISVSGLTVSYNAFTGSHFASCDRRLEPGTLVSMTGVVEPYRCRDGGEPVYGVAPSCRANDSRCLGSYLAVHEPGEPASIDNPHLIAAVGNGDMWVMDSGQGSILPGDYLISSDVPGCAMRDDPAAFPVGHIVARAGERVDWRGIVPDERGVRRARISVLFGNFVRDSGSRALADRLDEQQKLIQSQRHELDTLREQMRSIEELLHRSRP